MTQFLKDTGTRISEWTGIAINEPGQLLKLIADYVNDKFHGSFSGSFLVLLKIKSGQTHVGRADIFPKSLAESVTADQLKWVKENFGFVPVAVDCHGQGKELESSAKFSMLKLLYEAGIKGVSFMDYLVQNDQTIAYNSKLTGDEGYKGMSLRQTGAIPETAQQLTNLYQFLVEHGQSVSPLPEGLDILRSFQETEILEQSGFQEHPDCETCSVKDDCPEYQKSNGNPLPVPRGRLFN